jgi:hypothetical protein
MRQPGKKKRRLYSKEEEEALTRKRRGPTNEEDTFLRDIAPSDEDEFFYEETHDRY